MGLLDRFTRKPREVVDPVFGNLRFADGLWTGAHRLGGAAEPASVSIEAGPEGPEPGQRTAFQELIGRFPTLHAEIGEALWQLYEPQVTHLTPQERSRLGIPDSATALHQTATLDDIHFTRASEIELLYGLRGWDDAMLTIGLTNWKATPLAFSD